jgi:putative heme iron utilization protein
MVPVALDHGRIVVHVSGLAAHTAQMRESVRVSLMLMLPEAPGGNALALPRVSFSASAREIEKSTDTWNEARAVYLRRHPGAEMLFGFGDFALFELLIEGARFVAGFGAAYDVSPEEIEEAIADLLPLDSL